MNYKGRFAVSTGWEFFVVAKFGMVSIGFLTEIQNINFWGPKCHNVLLKKEERYTPGYNGSNRPICIEIDSKLLKI